MPRYDETDELGNDVGTEAFGFEDSPFRPDLAPTSDQGGTVPEVATVPGARSRAAEPDPSPFLIGPDAVRAFVAREWKRKLDYRLKKEVWTYSGNQVSILFEYEWRDTETDEWMLTHGEEHWEIAPDGLMRRIHASGQDIAIAEIDRWILPKPVMGASAAE